MLLNIYVSVIWLIIVKLVHDYEVLDILVRKVR